MNRSRTLCLCLALLGLSAGAALAQSTASDPAAEPGKAAPDTVRPATTGKMAGSDDTGATANTAAMKLSPNDARTMKACRAMAPDAMMADTRCKAFMAKHPQTMNSGEATPPK